MECPNPDHERFRGVFGCKNGCLACETEELKKVVDEMLEREQARAKGEPMANGEYPHLLICSMDRRRPLGVPGCVCDRRYSKLRAAHDDLLKRVEGAIGTLNIATPTNADYPPEHVVGVVGGMPAPVKWQCQRCGSLVTGEHCPCE